MFAVKLNTPGDPLPKDGWLKMWIDGKEVFHHDMRYRSVPTVLIRTIFDHNYSSRGFKQDFTWMMDNRVVARKYIGPMRPDPRDARLARR